MAHRSLTRRRFAGLAAGVAAARFVDLHAGPVASAVLSAEALLGRISTASGVTLSDRTVDGFKAGDQNSTVRGVAVTSMATLEVLRQAARAQLNLVLTFEPTFFGRGDGQPIAANGPGAMGPGGRGVAQDDPILLAKRQFLKAYGMVVYRLHDQWAARKEDEHAQALASAMGWTQPATADSTKVYRISPARLIEIVSQVRRRLGIRGGLRVIGDPNTLIRRVVVLPGVQSIATLVAVLPSTDLILAGETRGWEGPEYVGDASTAGLNKGLITVGRVVSEDPGMGACAGWLETLIRAFWSDSDATSDISNDPVFKAKEQYCLDNNLVVWRFHDNWHARNKPDMEAYATARLLGLASDNSAEYTNQQQIFMIPETTLGEFAQRVKTRMKVKTLRVVGDPRAKVSRVICGVGSGTPALSPNVDVAIGGEGIETDGNFDSTEYARDAMALGISKGFIILGHLVSEEPGMESCAQWLRTFIKAIPVQFVPAGEPFWS